MPIRKQEINLQVNQLLDAGLLALTFWLAHAARYYLPVWLDLDPGLAPRIAPFSQFIWMLVVIVPVIPLLLETHGFYSHPAQQTISRAVQQILRAMLWFGLIIAACAILLRLDVPSRFVPIFFIFLGTMVLAGKSLIQSAIIRRRLRRAEFREPVLLAGSAEEMNKLKASLPADLLLEMRVVDEVDLALESVDDLADKLHRHSAARVIFAGGNTPLNRIEEAIGACEEEGVEAWLLTDFIRTTIAKPDFDRMAGRPVMVFRCTPEASWALLTKEVMDRTLALLGLLALSPLLLATALIIRVTSPGPVLFKQQRAGRHGRPFTMLKFRSMRVDAEKLRAELEARNQMSGPVFKLEDDPRITAFGRLIRKTSIDELPQLINVLRGEMSLVGPRPLPVYEVEKFEKSAQRRRLSVKPGLTCLWQIGGRNEVKSFEEWVKLDLQYIDNWSLWLDMKILLKTIPVVLLGSGAK